MNLVKKLKKLSKLQLVLLILAAGIIVYFNSLFNGFVWDDEEQIVKNSLVHNFSNLPLIFKSSTFYGGGGMPTGWFYRPMMTLSYLINYSVWGPQAFGFHLFQVIVHLINAALVFFIFLSIFSKEKIPNPKIISFLAALVFVVHPANVEAVAYIAALQESLYTLFGLLIFLVLLKFKSHESRKVQYFSLLRSNKLCLLAVLVLLALLSKESAVFVIPLVFLFLVLFQKEKTVFWLVSSTAAFISYLFLRLMVARIPIFAPNVGPIAESSLGQRLTSLPYEIISYLRIIFFPKDLFISQHTLITRISDFRFWGCSLLILPVFILIWLGIKKRSKPFIFFAFWFFGSLSLVLNIIPLDMTVAERWLYFPFIGFLGMMGMILGWIIQVFPRVFRFSLYLFPILLILLGLRTIVRNSNWHGGLTLYGHDIQINKEAFDLENNYGVELFRVGKIEEAKKHFERSIELYPRWWFAYNNLGAVYQQKGDLAQARKLYEQTIKISDYYLAYENLGFILLKSAEPQETISFLEKAILKFPQNPRLKAALALAYYREGRQREAERLVREAYFLDPSAQNRSLIEAIISKKKIDF